MHMRRPVLGIGENAALSVLTGALFAQQLLPAGHVLLEAGQLGLAGLPTETLLDPQLASVAHLLELDRLRQLTAQLVPPIPVTSKGSVRNL